LALAAIPAARDYPVLFLTGHVTDRIEKVCVEKARICAFEEPSAVRF
jgi:hypothetical protein